MLFLDIIEHKKQRKVLTKEELHYFIQGYVDGSIADYQVSALLMAICFNGLNDEETAILTQEMLYSGKCYDLSILHTPTCDKHSTGGVGDKTTLALGPMVAACGLTFAKMSGRGLGHTGGTLDKLESIEGFQIQRSETQFMEQLKQIGIAVIGQSEELVPADKKLYALRDVTGTVDSISLIASSIMSKKLAAGTDHILLDVKYGEGAFMKNEEDAEKLARCMIQIGRHFHRNVQAIISDMSQPLGRAIGNALEVKEAIYTLQGKGPSDFTELCMQAGIHLLLQAKRCQTKQEARCLLEEVITSGKALCKLEEMVAAQGGNVEMIRHPEFLPQAKEVIDISSQESGYIKAVHAMDLGTLAMQLGAGRRVKEDIIDPAVGIVLHKKRGDYVTKGDILASVHINEPLPDGWLQDFYRAYVYTEDVIAEKAIVDRIIRA